MQLKFEVKWEGGVEVSPFKIENASSIKSLQTILDRAVGTHISHSFSVSEAVVGQISPLLLSAKDDQPKRAFAPHSGLSDVYIVLASLYFQQRVQAPSTNALKRRANFVSDQEGREQGVCGEESWRPASGFLCIHINQRRHDPEMSQLSAAEAAAAAALGCCRT
eukprot:6177729-Pleurochrysis_carterae.AAC.1